MACCCGPQGPCEGCAALRDTISIQINAPGTPIDGTYVLNNTTVNPLFPKYEYLSCKKLVRLEMAVCGQSVCANEGLQRTVRIRAIGLGSFFASLGTWDGVDLGAGAPCVSTATSPSELILVPSNDNPNVLLSPGCGNTTLPQDEYLATYLAGFSNSECIQGSLNAYPDFFGFSPVQATWKFA